MSRIGNRVLTIPEGVTVEVDGNVVRVTGPKGSLSTEVNRNITVKVDGDKLSVERKNDNFKSFHGTANANITNLITGVTKGNTLVVSAGYSHPVEMEIPAGIQLESPSNTELFVRGIDKQLVGNFAANVRDIRRPEPYKGKGIRYADEHVRRKEGKKAA